MDAECNTDETIDAIASKLRNKKCVHALGEVSVKRAHDWVAKIKATSSGSKKEIQQKMMLRYYCRQLLQQVEAGKLRTPFDRPPPKVLMPPEKLAIVEGLLQQSPFTVAAHGGSVPTIPDHVLRACGVGNNGSSTTSGATHQRVALPGLADPGAGCGMNGAPGTGCGMNCGGGGGCAASTAGTGCGMNCGGGGGGCAASTAGGGGGGFCAQCMCGASGRQQGGGAGSSSNKEGPSTPGTPGKRARAIEDPSKAGEAASALARRLLRGGDHDASPLKKARMSPQQEALSPKTRNQHQMAETQLAKEQLEKEQAEQKRKVEEKKLAEAKLAEEKKQALARAQAEQKAAEQPTVQGKGKGKGIAAGKGGKGGRGPPRERKHDASLKVLFWNKVQTGSPGATLWDAGQEQELSDKVVDVEELKELFPKKQQVKQEKKQVVATGPTTLLSHQRSQNVQIMLSCFKLKDDHSKAKHAIANADMNFLTADHVEALLKCCPTTEEEQLIKAYSGKANELGCAEHFLQELLCIPRVGDKVRALSLYTTFKEEIADIKEHIDILSAACAELRSNEKLQNLLHIILSLGNALNDGTSHVATGFKMDTLHKLAEMYAADKKTTLLSYLVTTVRTKTPEIEGWFDDLKAVHAARELSFEMLPQRLEELQSSLYATKSEIKKCTEPFCREFLRKMTVFSRECETALQPVQRLLEDLKTVVSDILSYYGESEHSLTAAEELFKTICKFGKLYTAELTSQTPTKKK